MENKNIPRHVAIIMDGNRRWAKEKSLPSIEGHYAGYEQFKKISKACLDKGVKILTIYAFSNENWNRNEEEVSYLMQLFKKSLEEEKGFFNENGIKLNIIGQIERLSPELQKLVFGIMEETKNNARGVLNLAISYGGRQEIIDAVKKIAEEKILVADINEEVFSNHLYTAGQLDPDFLIRTSGEIRLSGFLPWQSVYSELYFSPKLWPDFNEEDLDKALEEYGARQRRHGK